MITLYGTNGIHEIDLDNVLYWYQSGNSICFYTSTKNLIVVTLQNSEEVRNTFLVVMNEMFKYTASIASSNSIVYNLNCKKIISHSVSTTTITVNFNTASLAIVCVSSSHATYHNNYLTNVVYHANIALNLIGKTIYRVNPEYIDDPVNRLYNDIQSAITAASSGNIVIIEKSDTHYEGFNILLKNGVNILIEEGAVIENSSSVVGGSIFTDNGANVTCKILGNGVFVCNTIVCLELSGNSTIYFEYDSINVNFDALLGISAAGFNSTSGTANLTCKGLNFVDTEGTRYFDSDGDLTLFDSDVLYCSILGELFYPDNNTDTVFMIRNGFYKGGEFLFHSTTGLYDISFINTRLKSIGNLEAIINFTDRDHTLRLWNTIIHTDSSDLYLFNSSLPCTITFVNPGESNRSISGHTVTGILTVRTDLEIIE